jgi:hypothetical protein
MTAPWSLDICIHVEARKFPSFPKEGTSANPTILRVSCASPLATEAQNFRRELESTGAR